VMAEDAGIPGCGRQLKVRPIARLAKALTG
jgi:hypothetical protein